MLRVYPFKPNDYIKKIDNSIGFCEIQGDRFSQEDALIASTMEINGIESLTLKKREALLKKTFQSLQEKYGNHLSQGSTACVVFAWVKDNRLLTSTVAYIGDSSAYLILLKKNKLPLVQRLNKQLHNQPEGRLYNIWGSLSLNRAIGDRNFEPVGLTHEPEIDEWETPLPTDTQVFLVVACDGLVESQVLNELQIGEIVASHAEKSPEEIAKQLVLTAYGLGSTDNISVAVVSKPNAKPISVGVFDGHGGSVVSKALSNHFYPTLQNLISTENEF